jgi:multisubunit Na+/H+ antiporter MnhG subunit
MTIIGIVFATLGAGMILFALAYVTLLVGALVNAMVVLMAGPVVDRLVARKR